MLYRFTIINYDILKNFHTIEEKGKKYEDWELRREIVEFNPDLIYGVFIDVTKEDIVNTAFDKAVTPHRVP